MSIEIHNNKRIFGLDLVRAIAIILVLFSHVYYLIDSTNPTIISLSGLIGFTGVEVFFVLSGFLIGSILLRMYLSDSFTFPKIVYFLKRRWFRTLPNYYVVLIINIIIAFFLQYKTDGIALYFLFFQNLINYNISFFTESWSLSVEEWTYLLAPFLFWISLKLVNKNKRIGFLGVTLLTIISIHVIRYLAFLNNGILDMETWNTNIKSVVLFRLDVIFFGFLIAWLHHFYSNILKKYSVYLFIISIHVFFLQFFVFNVLAIDINTCPVYFNVFYFTLSSFTIMLGFPVFIYWNKTNNYFQKGITFLSKISYSIYLLHYSIMSVLMKYLMCSLPFQFSTGLVLILYLILTIFFSFLLYRFIEKPIMDLRDKI